MTLQNALQFQTREEKSKVFVDRITAKNEMEEDASDYFKASLAFLVNRSKYLKEENTQETKEQIVKNLESSLVNQLQRKKRLNHKLKNFNRDFESYDPMDVLKSKVKTISKSVIDFQATNRSLEEKLHRIIKMLDQKKPAPIQE